MSREAKTYPYLAAVVLLGLAPTSGVSGAEEAKANAEKGWIRLFNGKDLSGWKARPNGWAVEEGGVLARRKGAGYIWTEQPYGDFILDLEFKLAKGTNSGIFIRTANTRNAVQTGIEVQVLDSFGKAKVGKHDCGAVYDCLAPAKNAVKKPGEWNRIQVTCKGPKIEVVLNGEQVVDMDLDKWTQARRNPDGSRNKFGTAYKDMPRRGHIGFQDHGKPVWYRNIRLKCLDATRRGEGGASKEEAKAGKK
jgi:hypothetical protein